jgi:hypothetical protein
MFLLTGRGKRIASGGTEYGTASSTVSCFGPLGIADAPVGGV